ncbi:TPA: hypothetical protein PPU39_002922 [Salmonella enterica subsp. enterica]|nr:hypothetical protein [Salmonella enterica subsp. enterica]
MAENGYGLAGPGMGKVKSVNPYRLTPGFGGFTPVPSAAAWRDEMSRKVAGK